MKTAKTLRISAAGVGKNTLASNGFNFFRGARKLGFIPLARGVSLRLRMASRMIWGASFVALRHCGFRVFSYRRATSSSTCYLFSFSFEVSSERYLTARSTIIIILLLSTGTHVYSYVIVSREQSAFSVTKPHIP